MTRALNLLLIGCLLQGALCQKYQATVPTSIEVLNGSCVTIPCSFDIETQHKNLLDSSCKAKWRNLKNNEDVFDSSKQTSDGELHGRLTEKDCTTTLNNIVPGSYYFRLECNNKLKYGFDKFPVNIVVKDDAPSPTLTPSTLKVKEGTSVSLRCSAPAPCLSHPPNLTWTPGLGDSVETLQENQDKTKVQTSVLNFTASHLHHGKEISCTAVYRKQDGSTRTSVSSITADISYAPQILPSSGCTKTATQVSCSCETVGNPSPKLEWDLDGSPVNGSVIQHETRMNATVMGFISVNLPQGRDLLTFVCRSSNSLGSDRQPFYFYGFEQKESTQSKECSGVVTAFIITVCFLTAALVCALLFAIRTQRTCCTGDTRIAVEKQHLTSQKENEVSDQPEEDIYVNANELKKEDEPNTHQDLQVANEGSKKKEEKKNEDEGNDLTYSSVIWKSKKKGLRSGSRKTSASSFLQEEKHMEESTGRYDVHNALEMANIYGNVGPKQDVVKVEDTEYSQVLFRDQNPPQK